MSANTLNSVFAAILSVSLIGCANPDYGTKQSIGALLGGIGGAVAGSQFGSGRGQLAATAAGTLLGALLGSEIGKSLDHADRQYAQQATYNTLDSGASSSWHNPKSGNYGTTTPVRTYKSDNGQRCREIRQTVYIDSHPHEAYGTACQQPDGNWQIVEN